jgi:drug/metabolite transporter (DMT)-like permease
MTEGRRATRLMGVALLFATALGWGLNWPGMKLLLREWPPLLSRGFAGLVAAALLALAARARGESLRFPAAAAPRVAFAAFTNVFAWMGFTTVAMRWLSVAEGALLVYTMPIWATLLIWPVQGVRPRPRALAALALAFAGVAILLGAQGVALTPEKAAGVGLALAAAFFFALGATMNGAPLPLGPFGSVAWQVGLGSALMVALGSAVETLRPGAVSATGWAVLAYMTFVPMALCYLTWFAALRRLPAAAATTGMLLTPVVGIAAGAALLGEPFGARELMAVTLTFGGVALALPT